MQSVDISALFSAVDALGIRTEQLNKSISVQTEEIETTHEKSEEVATLPENSATDPMLSMSDEDAVVYQRLHKRLVDAKANGDVSAVKSAQAEIKMFEATLNTLIEFQIVDREGEKPGFWRTLVGDDSTKQFFIVIEAVVDGETVNWAVRDADSGKIVSGPKFGLRVNEDIFAELSQDKKSDGRFDRTTVGLKPVGRITPVWSIKTDGETITGF
jgi:hypothetical protein